MFRAYSINMKHILYVWDHLAIIILAFLYMLLQCIFTALGIHSNSKFAWIFCCCEVVFEYLTTLKKLLEALF